MGGNSCGIPQLGKDDYHCDMPTAVKKWIVQLDNQVKVKPIAFTLNIPQKFLKPTVVKRLKQGVV